MRCVCLWMRQHIQWVLMNRWWLWDESGWGIESRWRHHVFQGLCGSRGAHSTLRFAQFGIVEEYWRLPEQPTDPLCSEFKCVWLYSTTSKVYYVSGTWRILGPAPIMRNASHHPSWYIAKVCPTTQAGVSKRNRRLKTRQRWWEPTVDCQHMGHDVRIETANTRWGGLQLSLALSLYTYPSLTLCVWPSWIVVLFLQLFLVLVFLLFL